MANEAVILELGSNGGNPRRYTVDISGAIAKGTLLKLVDPFTVSGGTIGSGDAFAGIAAEEKTAGGPTEMTCYTTGIFDLKTNASIGITAGELVIMSGANLIAKAAEANMITGAIVGKSLETGSTSEVIKVAVGRVV